MRYIFLSLFAIALCVGSCTKKNDETSPHLDGVRVIASGVNTAVVVNKMVSNGGSVPTVVGTCWSYTVDQPTLENCNGFTVNHPGSDGQFTDSLKGLRYNTKYYLCAYATNAAGTAYSEVDSFYTLQTPYPPGIAAMGGAVLSVDSSGMHGLVVATPQYVISRPWAVSTGLIGGTSLTFGSGLSNTQVILAAWNTHPQSAAAYCSNLVIGTYDDWFLPSYDELKYFREHMTFHQWLGYEFDLYWSSSEATSTEAFFVVIGGGADFKTYDKLVGKSVLPMRRF